MVKRLKLSEKVLRDAEPLEGNSHQIVNFHANVSRVFHREVSHL